MDRAYPAGDFRLPTYAKGMPIIVGGADFCYQFGVGLFIQI